MKVIILTKADFAGSGYKVHEAISAHTDIEVDFWAQRHNNKYGHPGKNIVGSKTRHTLQEIIDGADIVHLKGDWPPHDAYMGMKILHKPHVQTVCGSFFRKRIHGGLEKWESMSYFNSCAAKTAFTPDLLYPEYGSLWTPHPIDSDDESILWKKGTPPVLTHMPTSTKKKDTAFIMAVFEKIKEKMDVEIMYVKGVPFKEAVEIRKRSTIFFDQFKVGFYGNSAIEAMQYGIPVCAWISPQAIEQAQGSLAGCPVISLPEKNVDTWAEMILGILNSDMKDLSFKTKLWCDIKHGYRAIAKQWETIYKEVL